MPVSLMQIAVAGAGKTYNALTFPKCYHMSFGRDEEDTINFNPILKANLVKTVSMLPLDIVDIKRKFDIDNQRQAEFCKCIDEARRMFKAGEIETLVIDPVSFMAEMIWILIEEYHPVYTKDGKVDILRTYGVLRSKLTRLFILEIINFPGNVVVNAHLKVEDEEVLKGLPQAERENPYVPSILGGIRHEIKSWFSLVAYLEKVEKQGGYEYLARTNLGNQKIAKSRYPNLPMICSNLSYKLIMDSKNKVVNQKVA